MGKLHAWWERRRPTTRRLIQLYSALLHNANLRGLFRGEIYTGSAKALCVPGLNCYSCPAAVGACPLGALQNALSSAKHRAGWYVLGILLLLGTVLGRTICGWLCPMGLIQELLHKIPTPKIRKSAVTRTLSRVKYIVLAVFVVGIPLWYGLKHDLPVPAFCKYICPAGTLEGAGGLLAGPDSDALFPMLDLLFTRKIVIMLVLALACIFCLRAFCRFLCPLGAIYGLFSRFALTGIRVDDERCNGCGACVRNCGMDVRRVGDRECIQCARCIGLCHSGAISMKAGRLTLVTPTKGVTDVPESLPKRGRSAKWVPQTAVLAVLFLALVFFNFVEPSLTKGRTISAYDSDAPVGFEIGQQLVDFQIDLIGGGRFQLSGHRGQVVFINLWATYCTPCVRELPYFDRLLRENPDIAILAVHSSLVTDNVAEFLEDKDWMIDFALDTDDTIFSATNGSTLLPQTVVLNRRGEVVYNQVGSITYEQLVALLNEADAAAF